MAINAGVKNLGKSHSAGYKGLYNNENDTKNKNYARRFRDIKNIFKSNK